MIRKSLPIDVSEATGLVGVEIAASLVIPENVGTPVVLAVALPGGGYSRAYWDIDWPGGYSQAEYHARRGWIFAAVDHLGIGGSSPLDPAGLTIGRMARAFAAASMQLAQRLRAGTLADSLVPMPVSSVIGMGHSMGGCVAVVAQGRFAPFDALAVLGYSVSNSVLPSPGPEATLVDADLVGPGVAPLTWCYHHDDVDRALRHEDLKGGFPFRTTSAPPWGCSIIPPAAISIMSPGVVSAEAARVRVPVFIGFGDRDVCPDPRSEPACYPSSPGVTKTVIGTMAHMHNFARSRSRLWSQLHRWGAGLNLSATPPDSQLPSLAPGRNSLS